jgi:hypothetical protein
LAPFFWRAWYAFGVIGLGHAMLPEEFIDGHDIEVWHLDRKIAVLPSNDQTGTH